MIVAIFVLICSYFVGSIPFGLLITKMAGCGDIRTIGSGNIGATNVLRTGKKSLAFLTLLMDMLKGTLAVLFALLVAPHIAPLAGLLALIGHIFPVWLGFKGGKGVATALGVFIALNPFIAMACMLTWLMGAFLFRISSASALLAVGSSPIWCQAFERPDLKNLCYAVILLVFAKHAANIKRLIEGTEPMIGENRTKNGQQGPLGT